MGGIQAQQRRARGSRRIHFCPRQFGGAARQGSRLHRLGVEDVTQRIVGTTANPRQKRIGNEPLENWLAHLLAPRIDFRFHEWEHQGLRMVVLEAQPAVASPVAFKMRSCL